MPVLKVVTLGGTIASVPDARGRNATPQLTADDLFAAVPPARDVAELWPVAFRQLPSGDLTFADIAALAGVLRADAAERADGTPGVDGTVITQGTDTLEETSYLLDLLYAGELPVVLTGAMRNPGLPGADGPANLLAAVRVAASHEARGLGPLVVFADEVHLPRIVRKVHSSSVAAFESPGWGPIGWVTEDRVRLPLAPRHRSPQFDPAVLDAGVPPVGVLTIGLGADPVPPEHAHGYAGVVVEGFGGGHVPGRVAESLTALRGRIPVVLASRTGAGEIYENTYAFAGSESDLRARGLISAGALDARKARILLTLLLAAGADAAQMADAFRNASN